MTDSTPSELQRLVAGEFDRQRWEYDLTIGQTLLAEIERSGEVNAARLAERLPAEFFHRNRTSRENVVAAIERAVGGRSPKRREAAATLVFADNRRYEVKLGRGAQINNNLEASKEDVLAAVEAMLGAGLAGDWNQDAARDLAAVIESRDDLDFDDVREITAEVVRAEQPKQGRVKELLGKIATGGLGGALGTGISTGLGELIGQLPM
jgi:hypothetical protein